MGKRKRARKQKRKNFVKRTRAGINVSTVTVSQDKRIIKRLNEQEKAIRLILSKL